MGRPKIPLSKRLDNYAICESGCWEWTGSICTYGYGRIDFFESGKVIPKRAHRVMYEYSVGPIPEGKFILHKCDNRKCVNPEHLYVGTQADNMNDVKTRKRGIGIKNRRHSEKSHLAVLRDDQVRELRRRVSSGQPIADAHREMTLPISLCGARKIIANKVWRHLK